MRPGMVIKHENNLCSVFSVEHRTPGNLRAFIQAKLRNLRTGAIFEHRFRSPDPIERVMVDEEKMEYLYTDGDFFTFMNTENYEQVEFSRADLGDNVGFLTANLKVSVEFHEEKPIGVELPKTVDLKVTDVVPALNSATVTNVLKPATTETGLVVQVPNFIEIGSVIRVDTESGSYLSRAK